VTESETAERSEVENVTVMSTERKDWLEHLTEMSIVWRRAGRRRTESVIATAAVAAIERQFEWRTERTVALGTEFQFVYAKETERGLEASTLTELESQYESESETKEEFVIVSVQCRRSEWRLSFRFVGRKLHL
jgi:hypothetical protein